MTGRRSCVPFLAAGILLLAGCSGEPTAPGTTAAAARPARLAVATPSLAAHGLYSRLPFPDSPDRLVANLQAAYQRMDVDGYRQLLSPDYLLELQPGTIAAYPDVGDGLDAREDRRCHERLFSGRDVTDPLAQPVPGVQAVRIETMMRLGTWTLSPSNDPIPDTRYAAYEVRLLFDRGPQFSTLVVQGMVLFYVVSRDSLWNGQVRPYYRLRGVRDVTDEGGAASQAPDELGVYLDGAGASNCGSRPAFAPFALYLLLKSPAGPTDGYECTVTMSGAPHSLLATTLPPGSLDMDGTADGFAVGSATPFVPDAGGALLLCTWEVLLGSGDPLPVLLGPATVPSLPGGWPVVASGSGLRRCSVASGRLELPVAVINGDCPPRFETVSLGALLCRYR